MVFRYFQSLLGDTLLGADDGLHHLIAANGLVTGAPAQRDDGEVGLPFFLPWFVAPMTTFDYHTMLSAVARSMDLMAARLWV